MFAFPTKEFPTLIPAGNENCTGEIWALWKSQDLGRSPQWCSHGGNEDFLHIPLLDCPKKINSQVPPCSHSSMWVKLPWGFGRFRTSGSLLDPWTSKSLEVLRYKNPTKGTKREPQWDFPLFFYTHFPFVSPIHGSFPRILLDFWNLWCLTCILLLVGAEPKLKKKINGGKKNPFKYFFYPKKGKANLLFLGLSCWKPNPVLVPSAPSARSNWELGLAPLGAQQS